MVYCKDSQRRGTYPEDQFNFLGFRFRPRKSKDRFGRYFTNFPPAVSPQAAKAMRQTMRRWALAQRSDKALDDLARMFNPVQRSHVPTRDRLRGARGLRTVRTGQRFLESFEALHALRRGTVTLRLVVPRYRPTRASMHETARAIVEAMAVLSAQLKKAA